MMKLVIFFLSFLIAINAHGILVCPPARAGQNNSPGLKLYPEPPTSVELGGCDVSTPAAPVATYVAGSTFLLTWDTTLLHPFLPGVRIAVSYSGADSFNDNVLVNGHDIGVSGLNTINVTLPPNKVSTSAIIQWVWASVTDGGYYLGCADIVIVASGNYAAPSCAATVGNVVFAAPGPGITSSNATFVTTAPTNPTSAAIPTAPTYNGGSINNLMTLVILIVTALCLL